MSKKNFCQKLKLEKVSKWFNKRKWLLGSFACGVLATILIFLISGDAYAQRGVQSPISKPLVMMAALAAVGFLPFIAVMVTSFVKIIVVLSILRTSMGTQQIPPNQVITGLALLLTVYIMMPVGMKIYREAGAIVNTRTNAALLSDASVELAVKAANVAKEPLREWLIKHCHDKDRALFYTLAKKMREKEDRGEVTESDFTIIMPAFVVSELKEAFQIGFIIFLPFIVIDMVVANILLALGIFMLSPVTISLPFKLLLFVLVDGWYLLAKGLVLGYQ
jgi:type III secretion protein R